MRLGTLSSPPPVVVISARNASPRSLAFLSLHVWAYLSKPLPTDLLPQTCARILSAVGRSPSVVSVEGRAATRRPLVVAVTLLSAEGVPVASGRILDLLTDGAQVDLGIRLAQDGRVRLAMTRPDADEPVIISAQVRWREGAILGVRFADLPADAIARLAALLD
jgi:hypothetical protein